MKSTIVALKSEAEFPRLMVLQDTNQVVLFTAPRIGTVVAGDYSPIGHHSDGWNFGSFKDFTGTVTLEN